jgi:hypothetical protein
MFFQRSVFTSLFLVLALSSIAAAAPCAHVAAGVNPDVVNPGGTTTVTAVVKNCSAEREYVKIHFSAKSACATYGIGTTYLGLRSGETRKTSVSYNLPQNACVGKHYVTARVYYDRNLIASSTALLVVK